MQGKYLTDEEMIAYYSGLAERYGQLTARYKNAICFIMDDVHIYEAMEPSMESEPFLITTEQRDILKKGFPLDSISIDISTGKHFYDLPEYERDQVAVEDGFLDFFRLVMAKIKTEKDVR